MFSPFPRLRPFVQLLPYLPYAPGDGKGQGNPCEKIYPLGPLRASCQINETNFPEEHFPVKLRTKGRKQAAKVKKALYQHKAPYMVHHDSVGIPSNVRHFSGEVRDLADDPCRPEPESNTCGHCQIRDYRAVGKAAHPYCAEIQPGGKNNNQHLYPHHQQKVRAIRQRITSLQLCAVEPSHLEARHHK